MQKVGIFSGAFDPIHEGHIAFAKQAIEEAGLAKVFFLVEPRPRHKQGVKAHEHRIEMVRLAIAAEPRFGLVILDQSRFTVHETWPLLQARFHGAALAMLMGEDVFARLSHWPRIDELITSAQFIIGMRGSRMDEVRDHLRMIEHTRHLRLQWQMFEAAQSAQSSSKIRGVLRKGKVPTGLPTRVIEYIRAQKLYSLELEG